VLLIIADISGYTRYMTANAKTLAHSQTIITELVKAIIKTIELPLEVAKLEGDAVFLYCRKQKGAKPWAEAKRVIGDKLLTFFRMFSEKLAELSQSTTCTCNACTHIEKLRLKVVVHSGEALLHHVFNFLELAGVDVIIVHRLLKNSIAADQYLLLTEAARHDLEFGKQIPMVNGSETYDDIGPINTMVYVPKSIDNKITADPATISTPSSEGKRATTKSLYQRFAQSWNLYCKLWFAPITRRNKSNGQHFHNVANSSTVAQRLSFAALTLLLTPFMLPVGALFVLRHSMMETTPANVCNEHSDVCGCEDHVH
jgi:hypothetical protein